VIGKTGAGVDDSGVRISENEGAEPSVYNDYLYTDGLRTGHVNGYPVHSRAALYWQTTGSRWIRWTVDGTTWSSNVDTPANFDGTRNAAYVEWNIADLF
jgi:hypothetical protein